MSQQRNQTDTLAASTVKSFTVTGETATVIRLSGTDDIWISTRPSPPTVNGNGFYVLPAGIPYRDVPLDGSTTVQLISVATTSTRVQIEVV